MRRRDYQKPTMEVVECEQEVQLLVESNGDGQLNPMDNPENL